MIIKPAVVFLTGITGTGKSTTGNHLAERCAEAGIQTVFINDYPLLIDWAIKNEGNLDKVEWYETNGVRNFSIQPSAYQELSRTLATWVAEKIKDEYLTSEEGPKVILIESARGAGLPNMRDRYDQHLFEPIKEVLGDSVQYVNIEMKVPNIETLLERVRKRLELDPTSAPEEVALKYISPDEGIQSAHQQAAVLEGQFSLNVEINNTGDLRETMLKIQAIAAQVLALWYREERLSHEDHENNEHSDTLRNPFQGKER